ncbi:MAG TPA: hypothetical protein VHW09_23775 [Bryobacteraceae bacterium]|jgi:hypothetical protein|nr:hypothetical protein [Bryobacteraceae bacterium]
MAPWLAAVLLTATAWAQSADRVVEPAPALATQQKTTRLTQAERAREYTKELFNPFSFVASAASAGWGQMLDRPREWGEGGQGFGTRFISSWGQHVVQSSLQYGLADVLHEDDRYVPSRRRRIGPRLLYALESTLQSRDENGERQVSYSKIGSLAGSSLLSRLWQPPSSGGAGNGAVNFGVSVAFAAGVNVACEFFPRLMFLQK